MARKHTPLYFAVFEVSRHYGGPEEGGWYYDRGRLLAYYKLSRSDTCLRADQRWHHPKNSRPFLVPTTRVTVRPDRRRHLIREASRCFGYLPVKPRGYRGRGSVIGQPDIEVRFMNEVPQSYPETTPHYE